MTVKALKRQLMAAIAMIMVSLVALSSSTYAWFTMNKTVTATGLTVKARTEGGILIKRTYGGTAADSVEFATGTAQSLYPISTADAKTWAHAAAANVGSATAETGSYRILTLSDAEPTQSGLGTGTLGGAGTGQYYYVYDSFTILKDSNSRSFTDLFVSECTVKKKDTTGDVAPLSGALRVAVVYEKSTTERVTYIYAPVQGADSSYSVVTEVTTNTDGTTTPVAASTKVMDASAQNSIYKLSANSGTNPLKLVDGVLKSGEIQDEIPVFVYVYFEGEDESLTTTNISQGLDNLVVTIKFSCSSVQ